jgi:hypothetical protein
MSAPIVVSYYGSTRAFTYTEMQNGAFDTWVSQVYLQYTDQPCQGVLSSITTTSTTNLTTNVINTILNLNTVTSSLTAIGSIGNNIGNTVNVGTGVKEEKQNKNEKNNNGNSNNNNSTNSSGVSNNNSNSNNGSNNNNNGSSQENGSGGEQQNQPPNSGGEQSGSSQGNENQGSTQGNSQTGQTNPNPSGNQNSEQTGQNNSQTTENPTDIKEDKQKEISSNSVKTTSKAKTETQKPAILMTGDIVGIQTAANNAQDARATMSFTRVKGDGTASIGLSADFMFNAKIGNISGIKSWIGSKANGNKHINVVSGGLGLMPQSTTGNALFVRVNSLKNFTAMYGVAGTYGKMFGEELISTITIVGCMYKGKLTKAIDATIIVAGIYSPYQKYYTESLFKAKPIIIPFINLNYKITKTFGFGLTGGGTYIAGQDIVNFQILMGAKLKL